MDSFCKTDKYFINFINLFQKNFTLMFLGMRRVFHNENILECVEVLKNEDLINVGFKSYNHFTIMNTVYLDVGRGRQIKVGCVGTPNEVVFLVHQWGDTCEEQDLVCVHNFDYDGYLTTEKVMNILKVFGK